MKKHTYRITINEPLVLVEKEKTEQSTKALEYIPGNIFRGLVAGALIRNNTNDKETDDIIFNGTVQFGDAHLVINNRRSYKVPLTYYYDKSKKDSRIFNYSELNLPDDFKEIKPKQIKKGYFVVDKNKEDNTKKINIQEVLTGDSIKSARSKEHRNSKEGYMYVYRYLKKGQVFEFEVISDNDDYLKKIKEYLTDRTKFIGKAKGSEYGGKVSIEFKEEKDFNNSPVQGQIIYAESNLCFLNEYGEFTAHLTGKQLTGNDKAEIDWKKSQVRYRTFMPYNRHRQNWDAERLIIEKGSVFVLKKYVEISSNETGCFLTEGYGRLLINPSFLKQEYYDKKPKEKQAQEETGDKKIYPDTENPFLNTLIDKKKEQDLFIDIQNEIDNFVGKNKFSKSITASQWSRAYNIAKRANNKTDLTDILNKELFKTDKIWKVNDKNLVTDFINKYEDKQAVYAFKLLSKKTRELTKYDKNLAQ